jgi:hypothetical protein
VYFHIYALYNLFVIILLLFCRKENPARRSPGIENLRSSPQNLLSDYDDTPQDENEHVHNTPPLSPVDARETSPPVGDLGGSRDKHVDFVSDLPSSGAASVDAAAVSDARLDSVNIEKDGSSNLATSTPMTAVLSDLVAVSTEKAIEKVILGQWSDADGNIFFPAYVLFRNNVAPSTAIVPPEAEPCEDAQPAPCINEGVAQDVEQSQVVYPSPVNLVPGSSLFTNLEHMESPVWNFSSQSPVVDAAVVSPPPVSAAASVGPIVQPQSPSGVGINIVYVEPVTKPSLPESSTSVDSNVMKDQPSSVPNPSQSSIVVTEKSSNIQEAQLPSKRKHPQILAIVTKLPKARFVGADGKLSLARGIPIPLPDHVVSIKPTSTDPAPSVVSECPSVHVQPSAHAPSIDPNSGV